MHCAYAFAKEQKPTPKGKLIDRIVAIVNEKVITEFELEKILKQVIKEDPGLKKESSKKKREELLQQILDTLIVGQLVSDELKRIGRDVQKKEIESEINKILKRNNMTIDSLTSILSAEDRSLDELKDELKRNLEKNRLIGLIIIPKISVTDDDIQNYYNKFYAKKKPDVLVRLRTIFIKFKESLPEKEKKYRLKLADDLLGKAKKGNNFAKMAKEYSESSSRDRGGDMGFMKFDELSSLFKKELKNKPKGAIVGPIKTQNGFYILKFEDKKSEEVEGLAKLKEEIKNKISQEETQKAFTAWVSEAKKKAFIDVRI